MLEIKNWNIYIIGCGGIGSYLTPPLLRFLNYSWEGNLKVTFIDGDRIEPNNLSRQNIYVDQIGLNKAIAFESEYENIYSNIKITSKPSYVTPNNIDNLLKDNSIIFSCVDNHSTRKLLSDYCCNHKNMILISGGNEYIDGNIQIHIRLNNINITNPITKHHPEIEFPEDKNPEELSCEELATSDPQIIMTNMMVASLMLNAFYTLTEFSKTDYNEINFNIIKNKVVPDIIKKTKIKSQKIYHNNEPYFKNIKINDSNEIELTIDKMTNLSCHEFFIEKIKNKKIFLKEIKPKNDVKISFQK